MAADVLARRSVATSVVAQVQEPSAMPPIVLFGVQFTFCLLAYALIAAWYVVPRLSGQPPRRRARRCCGSTCSGSPVR